MCVYNKSGGLITHDLFYSLFSQYGEVQRVLIFEKAKVWKTFVEMDSSETARSACLHLNNRSIMPDGSKMNIFPSNLQQINFQNTNLGGVDYSELKRTVPVESVFEEEEVPRMRSQSHWAHHIFDEERSKSTVSDFETEKESPKHTTSNSIKSSQDVLFGSGDSDSPPKIRKRQ